jgi:hypothetical protein
MAKGLLVAGFDSSPVKEDEFNDWYDTEHVPERRAIDGFISCERWVGADNPRISIATYDLQSLDVLNSNAYRAVGGENLSPWSKRLLAKAKRLCRFEAEEITKPKPGSDPNQTKPGSDPLGKAGPDPANGLLFFAMNVVPEAEADFNAWYDEEHIPRLSAVPGCLSARRFRIEKAASEGSHRYLALYRLTSPDVCASKAWEEAAVTPWTVKIRPHTRDRMRIPLRRYVRGA